MIYWAIIATLCVPLALGVGYLLGRKKKVLAQLKLQKDSILHLATDQRIQTKEALIDLIKNF